MRPAIPEGVNKAAASEGATKMTRPLVENVIPWPCSDAEAVGKSGRTDPDNDSGIVLVVTHG